MDPRLGLMGGRAYYAAVDPIKEKEAEERRDLQCTAQTGKGKRCKHDVSLLEPAATRKVCLQHNNADTIFYVDAHPKREGAAIAPKHFVVFFQALIAIGRQKYAARASQVLQNIKPLLVRALTAVGVPECTVFEAVDVENKAVADCLDGPFNLYGAAADAPAPEKYCIIEVSMPNPNPLSYPTAADFFASQEGKAIVAAMDSLNLGAGFQSWRMPDNSEARFEFTALPDLSGGGPCHTKEKRGKGTTEVRGLKID